ncbi:MAG: hypothetical protein PHQ11_16115 [Paludibacter sp.]|nr:hypothetical protein [Paludibacter sp.]
MKKILLLIVITMSLLACEKDEAKNSGLALNIKSCVLDNANSFAKVTIDRGEGFLNIITTDPDIAEIMRDDDNENLFYVIGHNKGEAEVLVSVTNETGYEKIKTIEVTVREAINYGSFSTAGGVYLKKGESRIFNLPFEFNNDFSIVNDNKAIIDNDGVASIFANESMGSKYKVTANAVGSTLFSICKGKVKLFDVRVFVVNEYDLFIPESENKLFFELPFSFGVNGITIWRGSGHYSAKVVDESIAIVKSITPGVDHFDQQSNSAVVRVTPLKSGTTKMIVTDNITRQSHAVNVVVY